MTPDRIKEILEGCEGVTPGPWYRESTENEDEEGKFTSFSLCADDGTIADTLNSDIATLKEEQDITEDGVFYDLVDIVGVQNIDHLSRLDPDTVRQLCLLALKGLEQEWQPIETALKDGTPIYVYFFEPDQVRIVSFSNKAPDDSHRDADKYYWYDAAKDSFWNERHAKMWMPIPLPSPPIQEQS